MAARGPARFDIGDDEAGDIHNRGDGAGGDGGGSTGAGARGEDGDTQAAQVAAKGARWKKPSENSPWQRESGTTSHEAVEEARRRVRARTGNDGDADAGGLGAAGVARGDADAAMAHVGGAGGDPAYTNDLAEAARRGQSAAHAQMQQALQQQQLQADASRQAEEEARRQQRAQCQQEEIRRHQAAFEQAAAARAAEEARQRTELLASLTPEELAQASELHARNVAVGSQVFGTPAASYAAGLVQQSHELAQQQQQRQQRPHDGVTEAEPNGRTEVDRLMAMSAEEFAEWGGHHQGF
jgi:hypothetical protein